ncbi:MAG: STAS domain-containing protein [Huintestinicola sp.]
MGTYLNSRGLRGERIMMSGHTPELKCIADMPEAMRDAVKDVCGKTGVWVITADKDNAAANDTKVESADFTVSMNVTEDKLTITLSGRVDSITAPQMLGAYESIAADRKFGCILIDCAALEYISSAGLRVLMIMAKQYPEKVQLKGVQPDVMAVLEQTGFDQIIEVL